VNHRKGDLPQGFSPQGKIPQSNSPPRKNQLQHFTAGAICLSPQGALLQKTTWMIHRQVSHHRNDSWEERFAARKFTETLFTANNSPQKNLKYRQFTGEQITENSPSATIHHRVIHRRGQCLLK
jgi:hypothetical protein